MCRTIHAKRRPGERLDGLAATGYCASLKRWFHGVREHLVMTPGGLIAGVAQLPGNRHDVHGLYEFMETSLRGTLFADNGYWAGDKEHRELSEAGIEVVAQTRRNQKFQYPEITKRWHGYLRGRIERPIGLFGRQFHAGRTLNRKGRHYRARRLCKAVAHNASRRMNIARGLPPERVGHYRTAA